MDDGPPCGAEASDQPAGRAPSLSSWADRGDVGWRRARERATTPLFFWTMAHAGAWGGVLCGTAGIAGCRGCENDRPYTPFAISESAALPRQSASASPPAPSASGATKPFKPQVAQRGTPGTRNLTLGTIVAAAPPDHWLAAGLAADFDADGTEEAVAWVVPDQGRDGAMWLFSATSAPRELWRLSGFVPTAADCKLEPELVRSGPHTVTIDVTAKCTTGGISRAPIRTVAVLSPMGGQTEALALRLAAPAPGETLSTVVRSTDRDGDDRDDITLDLTLRTATGREEVAAAFEWIDRTAGPSREAREPLGSLLRLARTAVARAPNSKQSALVLERVELTRRLTASVCAEAGTPRIFDREGSPFRCGDPTNLVDLLAKAEVVAALAAGDLPRAVSVFTRDGWFLAPMSPADRDALVAQVESAVTLVTPATVGTLAARVAPRTEPRWSPLRFEQPEPSLLVLTPSGVIRTSADGEQEEPADPGGGARPWSLEVRSSDGRRWISVSQACDRSELLLGFLGADPPSVPATVLAARPGACVGRPVPEVPAPVPLGFGAGGAISAVIGGVSIGPTAALAEPGTARSPDGVRLAIATALGVLVTGGEKPELWRGPNLDRPNELSDCVPANGGSAIACVRGDQVLVARR